MDDNGFSDPFCVIQIGRATVKSNVIEKSLNPKWNQKFDIGYTDEEKEVRFALFDQGMYCTKHFTRVLIAPAETELTALCADTLGDDDLGEVAVPIDDIFDEPESFRLRLPQGSLRVKMWKTNSPAA